MYESKRRRILQSQYFKKNFIFQNLKVIYYLSENFAGEYLQYLDFQVLLCHLFQDWSDIFDFDITL